MKLQSVFGIIPHIKGKGICAKVRTPDQRPETRDQRPETRERERERIGREK